MGSRLFVLCILALIAVVMAASSAYAGTVTYEVKAFVDSKDDLVIQGSTLMWHHIDGAAPGRWEGHNDPTTISSAVNGTAILTDVDWMPAWPTSDEVRYETDSSVFTGLAPALPAYATTATISANTGPMPVTVSQNPDASNGYTLKVHFADDIPDAHWYDVKIDVTYTNPFLDVPPDYWAVNEIQACVSAGIVKGYFDGTYDPTGEVARDQMAVFISRAIAGGDAKIVTAPATASFTDVPTDYWAFKYVEYAKEHSIVAGYPDGLYHPTDLVDRGQMAIFIARAIVSPTGDAGLASYSPPSSPSFPDVATDYYAYKYIEYIKSKNITGGYPDGTYQPTVVVTRDQMAVYIARGFGLE